MFSYFQKLLLTCRDLKIFLLHIHKKVFLVPRKTISEVCSCYKKNILTDRNCGKGPQENISYETQEKVSYLTHFLVWLPRK